MNSRFSAAFGVLLTAEINPTEAMDFSVETAYLISR
jgi:hypothetical protein